MKKIDKKTIKNDVDTTNKYSSGGGALYNFLNKNIKEFNPYIISTLSIIFLVLVGIISYKVNTTYAVFTDTIMGTKTIEITVKLPNLDKSGVSEPELAEGMIPVYYDESTETWKKASKGNSNKKYQWYDYDNKMWANSVTVSSTNRSKYLSANSGTEIPMDDILTMQVWIPRYKYKVWNYNSNTITTSKEQEIEITFENETESTGEITCEDNIQGSSGDGTSEICKLKATNETCTDDLCNGKTYTHPAFTFGDEEIQGFWIGKFELTGTINSITTKPNLKAFTGSTTSLNINFFETNIMKMKNSGNQYGLSTSTDAHMIKNSEWGAVAYLSHSKYGTCTDGTCKEVNINNSSGNYTGRSGGAPGGSTAINTVYTDQTSTTQYKTYGFYTYDGYLLDYNTNTKSTTKDMSKVASTTNNIYGVYDMSGGANEYTMANIVNANGTTMTPGKSGYTTTTYPDGKYYDKYSYVSNYKNAIIPSKLGDSLKEVIKRIAKNGTQIYRYGWYNDQNTSVYASSCVWVERGSSFGDNAYAGVFATECSDGVGNTGYSTRLIITP